jgi:hypothetical protein
MTLFLFVIRAPYASTWTKTVQVDKSHHQDYYGLTRVGAIAKPAI